MKAADNWRQRFEDLVAGNHSSTGDPVDAGARMVVYDLDGIEVFRAALARHHRFADNEQLVWIRPLVGGRETVDGYLFNLNAARRRSLKWDTSQLDDGGVVLELATGQRARIEPAEETDLVELERWDHFTDRLTEAENRALEQLDADSWQGRYA